ncbi:MAG: ion transporter [Opitutales bacterium]|nr:ion transporter [Opitutales bacterium]
MPSIYHKVTLFFQQLRDHRLFQNGMIAVILLAGITVGLETSPSILERWGHLLHTIDKIILWIFTLEVCIRIAAEGNRPWKYFTDPWNLFDFAIVVILFLPLQDTQFFAVLRIVRVLRVFRLITALPRLRFLVGVLMKSLPSLGYVGLLLGLLFYVFAVVGVFKFSGNDPVHFGDLPTALLTLFRVATLEDWTDVMYIQIFGSDVYSVGMEHASLAPNPQGFGFWAALYFIAFVICGSLIILNLFIGVIVNSIDEMHQDEDQRKIDDEKKASSDQFSVSESIQRLEKELAELKRHL